MDLCGRVQASASELMLRPRPLGKAAEKQRMIKSPPTFKAPQDGQGVACSLRNGLQPVRTHCSR